MRIINGIILITLFILIGAGLAVPVKDRKNRKVLWFARQHLGIWLFLSGVTALSLCLTFVKEPREIVIDREGYGGDGEQIGFMLKAGETTEAVSMELRARELTKEQTKQRMEKAFSYLDGHMKGGNNTLTHITGDLDFSLDDEQYPFDLEVEPEPYSLVGQDGKVCNSEEELTALGYTNEQQIKGISVKLKIILRYSDTHQEKTYDLIIYPKAKSALEKKFDQVKKTIEKKEREALYDQQMILPTSIDGVQISRTDAGGITSGHVLLAGFLVAGLLLLREQENLKINEKKRQELLQKSYPWFVNEVVLLFGAGMQMKSIIAKLIEEYKEREALKKYGQDDYRKALIDELKKAYNSMELGMSEEQVYYQLGRRLKLPCYIKMMTLLEQNVKKGSKGLTLALEQEEANALQERRNLAKRYGEEAGTKLLGPMIMLLVVIMLMIILPAFMSFA